MSDPILTDVLGAGDLLGVSERKVQDLRKHPAWPPDTEVRLGPRCVRFRVERLREFAALLAQETAPLPEPERLRRAREARREAANDQPAGIGERRGGWGKPT